MATILEKRKEALHIKQAMKLLPREQRHHIGAVLVSILREMSNSKYKGHEARFASPWSALCAGGFTRQMWVFKKPFGTYKRGDKVMNKAKYEHLLSLGASFRQVRFPKDKIVKKGLKKMAKEIAVIHHDIQFGFVPQRDCVESATRHAYAQSVYLLDFENAFDQVTQSEVKEIFEKVFLVNRVEAGMLSELCCYKGHLYQGNPLAPALFNIRALECVDRLDRLAKANGAICTVYADDVTISSAWWSHFSKGFQKTVIRIIHECGLEVNEKKCKVAKVSPRKIGHYDITGLTIDFDEATGIPYVRPLKRRRTLRKAQYLHYLGTVTDGFSCELSKDGARKDLACVEAGLRNWAKRKGELGKPQLTFSKTS